MPPGPASVIVQSQALFTIVFAALALGERPTQRQWIGVALAPVDMLRPTVWLSLVLRCPRWRCRW
jgi:O-acetylserine/cysteine efflux transporter